MHLTIQYHCRCADDQSSHACGVVVSDAVAARPVHEAGYMLRDVADDQAAAFAGLLLLLDQVAALKPTRIDVRCNNARMVEQITTGAAISHSAEPLFDQAMRLLLRLDNWQITSADDEQVRRAAGLSENALRDDRDIIVLDMGESPRQHKQRYTGVPQWTVELLEDPGPDCPARCTCGRKYPFGPDTPPGFCVHAAKVALDDGPLNWPDPEQRRMTTVCPNCEVPMRIELVD